jgi:hypothetical protein
MSKTTVRKTRRSATVEKTLYFGGQPQTWLVRPIPTTCRTTSDRKVMDEEGCGGTGWICPACHEGDDCPTVGSDTCRPGTAGALSCVCPAVQSGDWEPSTWA